MKLFLSMIILLLFFSNINFAKIYQIPEDLKDDVRLEYKNYSEHSESNESKFNLAMTYAYTGQIKKGWDILKTIDKSYSRVVIDQYSVRIKKDPTNWKSHFKIEFGYFFVGEKQSSVDSFYKVLALKPDMVWAMGFIGLVKGEMGEVDAAIKICKEASKLEPQATGIHFLLAEGYRKKGQYFRFIKEMNTCRLRLQLQCFLTNFNCGINFPHFTLYQTNKTHCPNHIWF
jgi:tetratricopeptide (TPR) repeat protein